MFVRICKLSALSVAKSVKILIVIFVVIS